jgi:CRP-like cAMP-binding protein
MLNQKIEYMSKKTTKEKVMAYLLGKAKEAGKESFTIDLDRQSLADYLGVERSAMSAEISKLKKEGYINVNKNHFEILMDMDL